MNRRIATFMTYLILFLASAAYAKNTTVTILAPVTCSEWLQGRKIDKEVGPITFNHLGARNEFWLLGLVTGMNAGLSGPNLLASMDSALIFDWTDRYCVQNPQSSVFTGVQDLFIKVLQKRKR
jgi:hypothetical protein